MFNHFKAGNEVELFGMCGGQRFGIGVLVVDVDPGFCRMKLRGF